MAMMIVIGEDDDEDWKWWQWGLTLKGSLVATRAAIEGLEITVILMIFFARMMLIIFFEKTILMQMSLYKLLFTSNLTS